VSTCKICQKIFSPRAGSKGIYCSRTCLNAGNSIDNTIREFEKRKIAEKKYLLSPKMCKECLNIIQYKQKSNKFCSHICSAKFNNAHRVRKDAKIYPLCKNCGKLTKDSNRKFCSNYCASIVNRKYKDPTEALRIKRSLTREASAHYRAQLRNQTPPWADRKAIKEYYRLCPKGYEVDHIIPISKGGLHDLPNLQYLTIRENRSKGNKIL
jgi:5-methylcytosine-specific restriction endonuclease McrA